MFNISRYNLSEILFILEEDEVYNKMDIRFYKEYMTLVTEVEVDKSNRHYIDSLNKASDDIKNWLNDNTLESKYTVENIREETVNGYIYTIEIRENHYY